MRRFRVLGKLGRGKYLALCLILLLVAMTAVPAAAQLPGPVLVGTVTVDGVAAANGTLVEALVDTTKIGEALTPITGGWAGSFRIEAAGNNAPVGQAVSFQVTPPGGTAVSATATPAVTYQMATAITGIAVAAISGGTISGSVTLQGVTDYSGVRVSIKDTAISAFTAANGSFVLSGLPAGTYTVVAATRFYLSAERQATVAEGATATLPPVTLLAGDLNQDGIINVFDLAQIGANFGHNRSQW